MRALRWDGVQLQFVGAQHIPTPAPGEAFIRPLLVGVSDDDVDVAARPSGTAGDAITLGQEFVGVVESVNGADKDTLVGRRVVGSPIVVCGACDLCVAGLSAHCRARTVIGLHERDGCFADVLTLPTRNLVVVPDSVDDDHAVFALPVAAAIQAVRQMTIEGRPFVTVLGDSTIGLLTAQLMSQLNASVRLLGEHASNLAHCEKWGVKHREANEVGRRADQDIVVDCTGTAQGLQLALQLIRPRGTILLKRPTADPVELAPAVYNEITIVGSAVGPVGEAVTMLAQGKIDIVSLVDRRMNLDDGERLIKAAAAPGALKIVAAVR
jgi:threonine dehydrogenase-like Zn-dependent dehydrogenase